MRRMDLARCVAWLHDLPAFCGLRLLDRVVGPSPEADADRIRVREESERIIPFARRLVEGI